jgi:hypothetical protein
MEYVDREFFLYKILSGAVEISIKDEEIIILPPTKEIYYESCKYYFKKVDEYINLGIFRNFEIEEFLLNSGHWSIQEEEQIKNLKNAIEDTKVNAFEKSHDKNIVEIAKKIVNDAENILKHLFNKKMCFYKDTCEGLANSDKLEFIIKKTSYKKKSKEKYKYNVDVKNIVIPRYSNESFIDEDIIRDIVQNDPWRTMWSLRKNTKKYPFFYPKREITQNQRMLIAWSQTYDNVYESLDTPTEEVINDNFLLDGWFIFQSRKRKQEKSKNYVESSIKNEKIKNSQEVFKIAKSPEEIKKINEANSIQAQVMKKQRELALKKGNNNG